MHKTTRSAIRSSVFASAPLCLAGTARARSEAEEVAKANEPQFTVAGINVQFPKPPKG